MRVMERGSFGLMRKMNQQMILEIIHKEAPISRAKIAEVTGLTPATVSNIVKGFIEMNLVKETRRGESSGGRRPILLELNPTGAYIIGLEWGIAEVKGVMLDLNSQVIKTKNIEVTESSPEYFIDTTVEIVTAFCESVAKPERIFGVGIGMHGLVDPEKGISLYAPHFGWEDIPFKVRLSERLNLPVFVDNDVRAMAMAEKWSGYSERIDDFIFINTGIGIGAGIVLNQELYYGKDWSAGEFGHMTIVDNGHLCSCGNYGCLEALISLSRLVSEYNPALSSETSYWQLKEEWKNLISTAQQNEGKAREILLNAAKHLGTGIANLVNLFNPQAIIIGGDFISAKDLLFPVVMEQVKKKTLKVPGKNLKIVGASFEGRVGAIGAAILVLQELFRINGN